MKKLLTALLISLPLTAQLVSASSLQVGQVKSNLGDLTSFEAIAIDTLSLVDRGDMIAAQRRITDFETAWDNAEPTLYPKDKKAWSSIDDAADSAISSLRAPKPSRAKAKNAVDGLIKSLKSPVAM